MTTYPQFPPGFLFGAATAAYQIEGAPLADGKGLSIWDTFAHTPGNIQTGETGDIACDTYRNPLTDIDLMADLGLNAYRFSIAWSRVMPDGKGAVNQAGLDYYRRLVDALLARNIRPYVTLFHWDTPQALQDTYGGFTHRDTAGYFADYAEVVVRALGDRVKDWITLNEPWEHAVLGHFLGVHAPGLTDLRAYFKAAHHLLLAHGFATLRIRSLSPDARVGATLSMSPIFPKTNSPRDQQAARIADEFKNRFFFDAIFKGKYPADLWRRARLLRPKVLPRDMQHIAAPIDFVGLNNYSRNVAHYLWRIPFFQFWIEADLDVEAEYVQDGVQYTSTGWEVYPQGIYDLLMRIKQDYGNPPIYITENGAAFTDKVVNGAVDDPLRRQFLQQYMGQAAQAIAHGVDLRGYFIWTLMDNFEWAFGFSKRFGLIYVDHHTQQRIVKGSGYWVRDMIRNQPA